MLQNQIFDPATSNATVTATNPNGIPCRLPFAGNIIPSSRFSSAATKLLAGLPAPNQTATLNAPYGFYNNYAMSSVAPTTNTSYTIRIDQNLGSMSKVFASYSSRDNYSLHGLPNLPAPFYNNSYNQDFQTHYTPCRLGSYPDPNAAQSLESWIQPNEQQEHLCSIRCWAERIACGHCQRELDGLSHRQLGRPRQLFLLGRSV